MPKLAPIKRKDLIRYLKQLGFDGPYPGGNHQYLKKAPERSMFPNPHEGDIGVSYLKRILIRQAGVDIETWEKL